MPIPVKGVLPTELCESAESQATINLPKVRDFPDGPVVETPPFHCRRHRLDPWLGREDPASRSVVWPKIKKKEKNLPEVK